MAATTIVNVSQSTGTVTEEPGPKTDFTEEIEEAYRKGYLAATQDAKSNQPEEKEQKPPASAPPPKDDAKLDKLQDEIDDLKNKSGCCGMGSGS